MHALLMRAPTQADDPSAQITVLGGQVNMLWVVIGAVLVIFMQAGFALVETGFCRAKHAAHVVSTNFAIFGLGFVGFFLVGFPLSLSAMNMTGYFGGLGAPVGQCPHRLRATGSSCGKGGWALSRRAASTPACSAFFLYMVAFMDTVATIPTGAMAERWKWSSFVIWGFFCGASTTRCSPRGRGAAAGCRKLGNSAHWGLGYVDFAGSGVVHAVGGVAGAGRRHRARCPHRQVRQGRQAADARPATTSRWRMLGTFILLFGWFGFNAASTFAATDVQFAVVAANTAIAGAVRRHRGDAVGHARGPASPTPA